ncbi:MAG: 50S ribosomal protein L6 [Alphaproteobacteria bacterium]
MSRIGKHPIEIPDGTEVRVDGQTVSAKGKLGEGAVSLVPEVVVSREDGLVWVKPRDDSQRARIMWGTSRSLVNNLVTGVTEGFSKRLTITGVGYRASIQGDTLNLQLGYSHDIRYPIPDGIQITCEGTTNITVAGADKQRVGQVAAEIRAFRKPEPYKGKGIRYANEMILRKEGKKK